MKSRSRHRSSSIGLFLTLLSVLLVLFIGATYLGWDVPGISYISPAPAEVKPEKVELDVVTIHGQPTRLQDPAYVVNGVTMVPFRDVLAAADGDISFDPHMDKAVAVTPERKVTVRHGAQAALIGTRAYRMERPSITIDGNLYVSVDLMEQVLLAGTDVASLEEVEQEEQAEQEDSAAEATLGLP